MQPRKPFGFTFGELSREVKDVYEPKNAKIFPHVSGNPEDKFKVWRVNNFVNIEHNPPKEGRIWLPTKLHINFGDKGDVEKGWNAILPIFMKYSAVVTQVKFINPEWSRKHNQGSVKNYDKFCRKTLSEVSVALPGRDFLEADCKLGRERIVEESKRMIETTPVTLYLSIDNEEDKLNLPELKKMIGEIQHVLAEQKFIPYSEPPVSDFRVNSFVSIRRDKHEGVYIDSFFSRLPEYWSASAKDPIIKAFADEKAITKPRPPYQPHPVLLRIFREPLGVYLDEIEAILAINLFCRELKSFYPIPEAMQAPLDKIQTILNYRACNPNEKFFAIVNVAEESAINLWEWKPDAKKEKVYELQNSGWCFGLFGNPPPREVTVGKLLHEFFETLWEQHRTLKGDTLDCLNGISMDLEKICEQERAQKKKSKAAVHPERPNPHHETKPTPKKS